jgi:hypothetical protein
MDTINLNTLLPVETIDTGSKHKYPDKGIALCLSGGGYRAMLFHLGALWRLNELGYLKKLDRISSVSGGSITAAVLAHHWDRLDFDGSGIARQFIEEVVTPGRKLGSITMDLGAVIKGALFPGSNADKIRDALHKYLFKGATLQDIPDRPRFVINASNVQSGTHWVIYSNISNYNLKETLDCPAEKIIKLARIKTRFKRLDSKTQERLINWGYAICDAALRKHVDDTIPIPGGFPYDGGVG